MALVSVSPTKSTEDGLFYATSPGTITGFQNNDTAGLVGLFVNALYYGCFYWLSGVSIPQGWTVNGATAAWKAGSNFTGTSLVSLWACVNVASGITLNGVSALQHAYNNKTVGVTEQFAGVSANVLRYSPDLKSPVQSVINLPSWTSGAGMGLLQLFQASSGQQWVDPYLWDSGSGANKLVLTIDATEPAPGGGGTRRFFNVIS